MDEADPAEPPVFREESWAGRTFRHSLHHLDARAAFLRFVDAFPALESDDDLIDHFRQYFCRPQPLLPSPLLLGLEAERGIDAAAARERADEIRGSMRRLAATFIAGVGLEEALPVVEDLRRRGLAIAVDILGEDTVCEEEAEAHTRGYLELLEELARRAAGWSALGTASSGTGGTVAAGTAAAGGPDWGCAPRVSISVKPSSMYSQLSNAGFARSVGRAKERLRPIFRRAAQLGASLVLDMEQRDLKNLTLAIFRGLLEERELRDYPHFGIVIQSYLRETPEDVAALVEWAAGRGTRFLVRLVKGAYWEAEVIRARDRGWPIPVYTRKARTDRAYEDLAGALLRRHDRVSLACASHNPRSIACVLETARELGVPQQRLEFQGNYGMAGPVPHALRALGLPMRIYVPYGGIAPGMAYLIRRLLEVSGAEAFQRRRFSERLAPARLVALAAVPDAVVQGDEIPGSRSGREPPFVNEPAFDWSLARNREAMRAAIESVRSALPYRVPLVVAGRTLGGAAEIRSENPNDPRETVGLVSAAGRAEALLAVEAAGAAFAGWRGVPAEERAALLVRAASAARKRRYELAALEVLEVGRGWAEADADVCEAIDALEYYARQMLRLAVPRTLQQTPGERTHLVPEPRGVTAVIAPWSFPLALSMGMTSAALVAGNTVVCKPSSLSPVLGSMIARLFAEAGLPTGVLTFVPGAGSEVGDPLVSSPRVAVVAFTGSRQVGLRLIEAAHARTPGAEQVKQVICEMGGKNAIIVDADAELDEAVREIVRSAFGYQGQKCSACSRLIVVDAIYDRLVARLLAAASSLEMGPAEDPAPSVSAVIDAGARDRILASIDAAGRESTLLLRRDPPAGPGYRVPLAIFGGVRPEHRIAREEIFGPVLAIMRAADIDEAFRLAGESEYALTGSLFSRNPRSIGRAFRDFRVGNLYINRRCTEAVVGRHPFGGLKMSGFGAKAGGPDYLQQFMVFRSLVENTFRRGFAPQ